MIALFFCFILLSSCQKYIVVGNFTETKNGLKGTLRRDDSIPSDFPNCLEELDVTFFFETQNSLRMKILDPNSQRWEVPGVIIKDPPVQSPDEMNYDVNIVNSPSFYFQIVRKSTKEIVFETKGFDFYFCDQYIELSTSLSETNPNIYGLGERKRDLRLDPNNVTYTIWSKDGHGTPYHVPLYGSHPMYLQVLKGGMSHGVFFLNSNAMDFQIDGPSRQLKWRTIGGIIDISFFLGPKPNDVIKQYHDIIGHPRLNPYWSYGNHQCRWGYLTINSTKEIVEKFREHNFPLDGMWNDLDYMDGIKDFTYNPVTYPLEEYQSFIDDLHKHNQHYVQIFDPGLKIVDDGSYDPYSKGIELDIFIKNGVNSSKNEVNLVWPGYTVFPDWWNEKTQSYWTSLLKDHLAHVDLSGFWCDMNEPDGFCDGECHDDPNGEKREKETLPYLPPDLNGNLNQYTLDWKSMTSIGPLYNVHDLYGYFEGRTFYESWVTLNPNKRPFILSRSTFPGNGRYTSHWLGDGASTFDDMKWSISGVLAFNFFGIPQVGADICGFTGWTTEELCTRYYQVGAFHGFMRNHNNLGSIPQEPWVFGPTMLNATRKATLLRYSLLPTFYTFFADAHQNGGSVLRPLFFEFFEDPTTFGIDTEFLLGDCLVITPVVVEKARDVDLYIPKDAILYDYFTGKDVMKDGCSSSGSYCTRNAPLDYLNVHVIGGKTLTRKEPKMTTYETRMESPFEFVIALDDQYQSSGSVYIDDGVSFDFEQKDSFLKVELQATKLAKDTEVCVNFETKIETLSKDLSVIDNLSVGSLAFYGMKDKEIETIEIEELGQKKHLKWNDFSFDANNEVLMINNLQSTLTLDSEFMITIC